MKLAIELNGNPRTLELGRAGEHPQFSLEGKRLEADALEVAPGIYSVLIAGQSFEVRVEPRTDVSGEALRVVVGGREFSGEVRDPRRWQRHQGAAAEAQGRQQVLAPMPGKIIRLLVQPGDAVEVKQGLIVVEAMKMQNEIRSPKTGTVERLMVTEGQTVNAGEILAIIG
jgi:biotin carboxyl carrier protein